MIPAIDTRAQLRTGNLRFVEGKLTDRGAETVARRGQLAGKQEPPAIILGCSDSRVPAEMVFDQGLGLAAGMRLTYDLDGDFELFTAMIGIDAETNRRGDCEFVVLGDGRELFRQRVRGRDEASLIKVDVSGVRELTIAVDPGKDLDISDHANWAEASLLQGR